MKPRILILGSQGMAGYVISKYLADSDKYTIITVGRKNTFPYPNIICDVKNQPKHLEEVFNITNFDYIINCIGILIADSNKDIENAIWINSYFPHFLEKRFKDTKTKIIHISTDCVMDGKTGNYVENDIPTETNIYGRTKALGEINNSKDLTIRLSIIGEELKSNGSGLFNWVIKQKGEIKGYNKAIWNGITTLELAKAIHEIIQNCPNLSKLYHLAPDFNISKYDLVKLIVNVYNLKDITVIPNDSVIQNKTLINTRKSEFYYNIPSYEEQLIQQKEFNDIYLKRI